jgi:putative DNA primase/helicase
MLTLHAIAQTLGGRVSGREVLVPTPGHSKRDRGTAIRLAPGAPDGLLVACYNGGWREIAMVKDALRDVGLLPGWDGQRRELTDAERAAIAQAELEREREKAEAHKAGAVEAQQRLSRARPADPAHPYLARKRIGAERIWQAGQWLLVPMQDETGSVWNVQRIAPTANDDGGWPKIYLKGARTKGLFWWAGKPIDRIVVGEGMGTVAAVRRATGLPVVAAMTADNLPAIASLVRAKRPDMAITIAADDDPKGHAKAREAAALVGASIAYPGSVGQ